LIGGVSFYSGRVVSYEVFARKYRPKTFADILGQDHVVQTLRNAIEKERLAHAYLFVGPRGTGKTSTARIFAKALNAPGGPKVDFDPDDPVCREIAEGVHLDVLEIDGASNNGVEQVRELRETVKFSPSSCRYKIYYIDEVHMLSPAAFNALLKTLEEPPPHVKFIFATTEPNKILPTILSRCQRFDLRRIPAPIIAEQLLRIAREERVDLEETAAYAIAKGADGGMRDAQSMLDQLVAFCGTRIREEDVLEVFGFTSMDRVADLTGALLQRQTLPALELLHQQNEQGKDLSRLLADVISYLRNLLVAQVAPDHTFEDLAPEVLEKLHGQIGLTTPDRLLNLIDHFAGTEGRMKWATNKELHLEIAAIKGMQILSETNLSDVIGILRGVGEASGGTHAGGEQRPSPSSPASANPGPATPERAPGEAQPPAPETSSRSGNRTNRKGSVPAQEEAGPDAAPERPPAEPGDRRGKELWDAVLREIAAAKPLLSGSARSGVFLEETAKKLVIGFSPADAFSRDSLMREKARGYVEDVIARLGGKKLSLSCELREDIESPEKPEGEAHAIDEGAASELSGQTSGEAGGPEAEPGSSPDRPAGPTEPTTSSKTQASAGSQNPSPSPPGVSATSKDSVVPAEPMDEEQFRNDELIQEALRLFEGELEN